ncbi:hypothetical protein HDU81_002498 [Chytriomyces hyalinus]|nr:hypothetical protein HDU81_002498 [Chytriomyces hyalinus]
MNTVGQPARKFFARQLFQMSYNDGEYGFADFKVARVWLQGMVMDINRLGSPCFLLDDGSGPLVRVDVDSLKSIEGLEVGHEVAVIGMHHFDQEQWLLVVGGTGGVRLMVKDNSDAASKWALSVISVHERVYYPMLT